MKIISSILFLFTLSFSLSAQENKDEYRGTIKVRKSGHINKIIFDNVNYRLVAIDEYGNPLDSAVTEFQMGVSIKGIFYNEKGLGPQLTTKMQNLLGQCDQKTLIVFDKIKAKDKTGTILQMPKFTYSFGSLNDDSN